MEIRKMAFHNAIALFFHEPSSANVEPSRLKFPVGPSENVEGHLFIIPIGVCLPGVVQTHAGGCDLSTNFLRSRAA